MNTTLAQTGMPRSYDRELDYSKEMIAERIEYIRHFSDTRIAHLNAYSIDSSEMKGNIENAIGCLQVPVGIAGPLKINGTYAQGEFLLPLATTEGTLVTGLHNGAKLISGAGGAYVKVMKDQIHVSPVFLVHGLKNMNDFINWVEENIPKLQAEVAKVTRHGALLSVESKITGIGVIVTLRFSTGDASGLNMVTLSAFQVCNYISEKLHLRYYLRSNYCSDKKNSANNFICGYGKQVYAEVTVSKDLIAGKNLHTSVDQLVEYAHIAHTSSLLAGMQGSNAHASNIISGMFLATGQDLGHVVHSAQAITTMQIINDGDLYMSVTIPNLVIGTVGGGTGLPTQKECLEILGCSGKDKALKFAEIIGAAVLAAELSIIISLTNSSHIMGHEKYGRNKPNA